MTKTSQDSDKQERAACRASRMRRATRQGREAKLRAPVLRMYGLVRVPGMGKKTDESKGFYGAGDGNRTHVIWLGTRSSTIELHPHRTAILAALRGCGKIMGSLPPPDPRCSCTSTASPRTCPP